MNEIFAKYQLLCYLESELCEKQINMSHFHFCAFLALCNSQGISQYFTYTSILCYLFLHLSPFHLPFLQRPSMNGDEMPIVLERIFAFRKTIH